MPEIAGFRKFRRVLAREPVRFAVIFLFILALVFGVHRLVEPTRFMQRYIEMIARSVELVLRLTPFETKVQGSLVKFHTFTMRIVSECSGAEAMAIFCASVIAFPATVRQKLLAIGLGMPALYVVNVLRLVCLGFIGAFVKNRELFHFAHIYVWQTIFILFVVCIWLLWIEKVVKRGRGGKVAGVPDS